MQVAGVIPEDVHREKVNRVRTGERGAHLTKTVVERVRLLRVPGVIAAAFLVFCVPAYVQNTSGDAGLSAGELLRRVVHSELKAQADDHTHWMYEVKAGVSGKEQVKVAVQTREGYLDRLRLVNGRPITPEQEKREDQRIARLLKRPDEQKKQRRAQEQDARQTERLFKMLPDAVTARYGKRQGELVEILFEPNSNFHPSSHEAAVFHAMEGRIWVNTRQNRLVEIEGHLTRGVKFGGGVLGHLDKGGEFHAKQSEVAPGLWEITLLHVNTRGKALFFKTIAVQENEIRTNFQRAPDNLTLSEAAKQLQRQSTVKSASGPGGPTVPGIDGSRSSSN
jgi:actin-related protein